MVPVNLAKRAMVVEEAVAARPSNRMKNLLEAARRKGKMMEVKKKRTTESPVNTNSRRQLRPCALMEEHLCTPLTANLSRGHVRLMR